VIYRSVIAFSRGRVVEDLDEKRALLEKLVERIQPGRWQTLRQPTTEELRQTGVVEFELEEVSAKILPKEIAPLILPGGEMEAEEDASVSPWTGILPYRLVAEEPIPSSEVPPLPEDDD
jgi:hypothetical protein